MRETECTQKCRCALKFQCVHKQSFELFLKNICAENKKLYLPSLHAKHGVLTLSVKFNGGRADVAGEIQQT